jgi:nucleotide-binding universal stress UspA family protein
MTTGRILVGYDGSAGARTAADWALNEAAFARTSVQFLYAYEWPLFTPAAPLVPSTSVWPDGETEWRVTTMLDEARAAAAISHPSVRTTTAMVYGAAAAVLADRSRQAGLIVVGSHGHGGWAGMLLGSVSTAVAAHAHCPVVVVRGRAGPSDDARPIAVGVDGSACAELALRFAFEQAAEHGVGLTAIRACPPLGPPWNHIPAPDDATALDRAVLDDMIAVWREKFPAVPVTARVVADHPVPGLLAAADAAQLIVVGSRGHGRLSGPQLGSVSRQLIQHARCPVAVIRDRAVQGP